MSAPYILRQAQDEAMALLISSSLPNDDSREAGFNHHLILSLSKDESEIRL